IGLIAVNISQPGKGIDVNPEALHGIPLSEEKQIQEQIITVLDSAGLVVPPNLIDRLPDAPPPTWQDHILDIFPENIAKAVAEGQVLPIVVFSVIFGIALALLPEQKKRPMLEVAESLAETMFKFTNIIMFMAPLGVGAAIAHATAELGTDILFALFKLLITLYCALIVFALLVFGGILRLFRIPFKQFFKAIK